MNSEASQGKTDVTVVKCSTAMRHFLAPPDANVHDLLGCIGNQMYFDFFSQWNIRHFDLMTEVTLVIE